MRRRPGAYVVGLLGVTAMVLVGGAAVSPSAFEVSEMTVRQKLRGDLAVTMRTATADDLIPISIVLRDQAARDDIRHAPRWPVKLLRRAEVIARLEERMRQGSEDLLRVLHAEQTRGSVGEHIRPLWIGNAIATRAVPRVILRLARRPDVAYLNHDKPLPMARLSAGAPGNRLRRDPSLGFHAPGRPVKGGPLAQIECGVELMGAPRAWNELDVTGENVVVAVIDTGACITHPDLEEQIWINTRELDGKSGVDDDGNGYVDDLHGWNFRDGTNDVEDDNGHGTHVAGTIAGNGSSGTQTGMAPDARLMILKVWNNIAGESIVWEATQYAVENGADIINGSLGWPHLAHPDRATWRMVCENAIAAGVVVVYNAGGSGNCCPPDNIHTPGDVPDVITVGATDCNDVVASFSSRGPVTWQDVPPYNDWPYPPGKTKPTVAAPGVNTVSTSRDCSGYRVMSGTSMATPHASGTAALVLAANPDLDHLAVKEILMRTAVDLGEPGMDNTSGAGRVDAWQAVREALRFRGDVNGDGVVDFADLLIVLTGWGPCDGECPADLDGDGVVDFDDLLIVLANWG